ncbi:MAG: hypothetical protein JWP74_129 [Marmoricola sp.]|nr:hypothetical protein [Marmoricola sp.]
MSWTDTHRRWQALQEIEVLANAGCTDLPWNDSYAEIFGDRDGLAAALRYRWELHTSAQLDTHLAEPVLEQQRLRLVERNAGVLRLLERHETGAPRSPLTIVPEQRPATGTGACEGDRVPA